MSVVIDRATGKEVKGEVPMFLREDGEKLIADRRKEMEVYVKLWNTASQSINEKTLITLNPYSIIPAEVGAEQAEEIKEWWNRAAQLDLMMWLIQNKHKVNGKFGQWSCGSLGSRWSDVEICGRNCRIAFYSKKSDASMFPPDDVDAPQWKGKNYLLMIDPTL